MEDFDLQNRLELIRQFNSYSFWGFILIIIGTIGLAIYKKKKNESYKLVIILGIGIVFLYGLISAIIADYLVSPIYNLGN